MQKPSKKITVQISKIVSDELDRWVNGIMFRSRSHAYEVIIKDWLSVQNKKAKGEQASIFDIKPPARGKK
jgi:metal-responsive CopG/Arc/MetJ family transcriptional regulator